MAEARKTTMGHITQDHLCQSTIALPSSLALPNMLAKYIEPIFDEVVANNQEIIMLTKQRKELLPLLMNGQAAVNYHLSFGILFVYLFLNSQNMEYVWQQKIY
mgnify:FL=1